MSCPSAISDQWVNMRSIVMTFLAMLVMTGTNASAEIRVVATIKPVHSLVAAVMEGVGTPRLLLDGAASPHAYNLKPSQAADLQEADLIFWIGPDLETFLERAMSVIGANARVVELAKAEGVVRLKARSGGNFAGRHHIDGDAGNHHVGHDDAHGLDSHIWLDPKNAASFVKAIGKELSDADPDNADRYIDNVKRVTDVLDQLLVDVETDLKPVAGRTFIAFHDAYQHFEMRFGVRAAGAITINPEVGPGADHIRNIKTTIEKLGVSCIFSEPQFQSRMINVIVEGTGAKTAVLDPLGATLENGPSLYPEMIRTMARSISECLGDT